MEFIKNFINVNNMAVLHNKYGISTMMYVKNFRVYLSYNETKSYLGTAAATGPIEITGALAALSATVGGPVGAVVCGDAGLYGASRVVNVTKEAVRKKKGVWIGWDGIGIH